MKTYSAKPGEITRDWYVVDAEGKTLGRLATQIADRLRGKGKPQYTPHVDTGDFVVVVNAEKIAVTGNKLDEKIYYRHSGYPGGLKQRPLREQLERRPTEVLRKAVKGMLPQQPARAPADHEAEDLRRSRASPRGAGAEAVLMSTTCRAQAQYLGTGKRKTSVARVILRPGDGKTWINGKTIEDYFPRLVAPQGDHGAAQDDRARGPVRPPRARARRRARPARPAPSATASPARSSRSTRTSASC